MPLRWRAQRSDISDKADNSANMDYPAFEKLAIEHSVRLTQGMLKRMA